MSAFWNKLYTASQTYPGLFGWGEKTQPTNKLNTVPQLCSLADLDAVSLPSNLVTTQQKNLPDKANSPSVNGTVSYLAWKGLIHILFLTSFTQLCHTRCRDRKSVQSGGHLCFKTKTEKPQCHCSLSGSKSQTLKGPVWGCTWNEQCTGGNATNSYLLGQKLLQFKYLSVPQPRTTRKSFREGALTEP